MHRPERSRRTFLLSSGGWLGSAWLGLHWADIVAAARHADPGRSVTAPALRFLSAAEAADVEAFAAQIIPSGATAGAREARVVHFIDYALSTDFEGLAAPFRERLAHFESAFHREHPQVGVFARADEPTQHAFVASMEGTAFFQMMRFLTVLGFLTSPRYGGNAHGLGWKAIGFEDRHVFSPPFGDYDRDYPGFVPDRPKASP